MIDELKQLIDSAERIVILQADNPDADSLGSALALEQILGEMGKDTYLYCAVDVPTYLRYLPGWDRINPELPSQFDLSIIVDASTLSLFQKLEESTQRTWLRDKPCIVLDHHKTTDNSITFATVVLNQPELSSTGEVIFQLAKELSWPLDKSSGEYIATSILGDTQGLTNALASAQTYRVMAELVDLGVSRPHLEELRRESTKMHPDIYRYKALLITRTEFAYDGAIATVVIPQEEIVEYSPLYNPGPLIQPDMLSTSGVRVGVVFKTYDDGKITAMIRCNAGAEIANKLAEHFGGGGHGFAAGFKVTDGRSFNDIKSECLRYTADLLQNITQE